MPHFGSLGDDAVLFVSAKALAEGRGYRILSHPEQPWQTKYPPLYPAYLSLIWRLDGNFPYNLPLAALFAWLLTPPLLILSYLTFRKFEFTVCASLLLTALLALNPSTVYFGVSLLSEVPYTCLLLGALLLLRRAETALGGWRLAAAAGVLSAAAFLTRTAGVALLVSGFAGLLLRRQARRAAAFAVATVPAIVGWLWWTAAHRYNGRDITAIYHTDYLRFYLETVRLSDLPVLLWANAGGVLIRGAKLILPTPGESAAERIFSIMVCVLAFSGIVRMARRLGLTPYYCYAAAHLLLLLPWNFPANQRLLFPLAPLLMAGLFEECRHMALAASNAMQRPAWPERVTGAAFLLFLLALAAVGAWRWTRPMAEHCFQLSAEWRELRAGVERAYRWIAENTPQEACLLGWQDGLLYLKTGRYSSSPGVSPVPFFTMEKREAMSYYLAQTSRKVSKCGYLLLTTTEFPIAGREELDLARRLLHASPFWKEVYRSSDAVLYKAANLQTTRRCP